MDYFTVLVMLVGRVLEDLYVMRSIFNCTLYWNLIKFF